MAAREIELPDAEIVTGSGMLVSRFGHVVTNHHVIAGGELRGRLRGVPATFKLTVRRIEVRLPPARTTTEPVAYIDASLIASDPDLDLAILAIPGNDFPYVPFGDSDAIDAGETVSVVGYPLGSELDIGRAPGEEAIAPAVSTGVVSALRQDAQGNVRYIQTSAPLNFGNSGGPLLDSNGFAAGVVQMKMTGAESIGFAIPVNLVKEYLARIGVDTLLPASRLTLGPVFESADKLIRLQVPNGFEDAGPSRLGVSSGSSLPGVALRIDRVAATWSADRLEEELRSGGAFEGYASARIKTLSREGVVLRGQASGRADGNPFRLVYAIADLGDEKVVARYIGSAEQIAFNESVLTASLASLSVARMLSAPPRDTSDIRWIGAPPLNLSNVVRVVPAGWILDAGGPGICSTLPAPRQAVVTSPGHDFRTSFRVGEHDATVDLNQAAARCRARSAATTGNEYRYAYSRFGVAYTVAGHFLTSGPRTLQFEVVSPTATFNTAREHFSRWIAELGPIAQ
jgi:S1-C subfamily serine protease